MTATKKINRVGSSILAVVIVAINLAAVANLYAQSMPPNKNLYDHSRIKNLDADDAKYIMSLVDKNNMKGDLKSVKWMFFDNLRVIDKETAASITSGTIRGVVLGVTSIEDDTLTQLLNTYKDEGGKKDLQESAASRMADALMRRYGNTPLPRQAKEDQTLLQPCLRRLVFNRLKTLSDAQVRMLMKWRGWTLVVPNTLEISTEAHTYMNDYYRRWEFEKLSEGEMEAYRQQLIEDPFF